MRQIIKITASINVALETLADLLEGRLEGYEQPAWGWRNITYIVPAIIKREIETTEEPDGHGRTTTVPTGHVCLTRSVSFWQTNEFHLATIHLSKEDGERWNLERIDTAVEPQYGGG